MSVERPSRAMSRSPAASSLMSVVLVLSVASALTLASQAVVAVLEHRGWPVPFALTLRDSAADLGIETRFREQWLPTYMDDGSVSLDGLIDVLAFSAAIGLLVMASRRLVRLARLRDIS
jgi:hypothetical protein